MRIVGPNGQPMRLNPRTINHRIGTLSLILGNAVRRQSIAIMVNLSVGGVHWLSNRYAPTGPSGLRTVVCVLGASGARNTEVCLLRPADLDFVHGKIRVGRAKTRRGVREIDMTPWLQRQLEAYVEWLGDDYPADAPLIPTCLGTFYTKDSLDRRLKAVHREATAMCLERRLPSLPTRLTGHVGGAAGDDRPLHLPLAAGPHVDMLYA